MAEYINRKILVNLVLSKLKYMGDARIMNQNDEKVLSEIDGYEKAINEIQALISDKDLIEKIEPVKQGRWSECYTDSHHYSGICSVCGRASIKSLTENLYEYCPKCGAKMCVETTYKPIKVLEDIKTICSKRRYCQDTEKGNCQFYDKNTGYCIFEDMPEDWNIKENKEKLINRLKNAGVKNE